MPVRITLERAVISGAATCGPGPIPRPSPRARAASGERENTIFLFRALLILALRPAAPDAAIPPADEFQALLVARPVLEARELQVLLGRPALAGNAERLHLGGGFLQQAELVARVLLGAEPAVDAGVAGDQPVPVHRDYFLDEDLSLERIHVDEAAARHRPDRDRVDDEHDLLARQPHHDVRVGVIEAEIGSVVPPSSMVLVVSKVSSTGTTSGFSN